MARKSPWQQFSDNFSSVYGSFKELGQGIESARIMAEKPEVITLGGIKQPHQDYQATYGGQTYDKEITPEMLTGLRNQRLADVKRKYGDVQGAMDMELKGAQLIESQNKAKLDEATRDSIIRQEANKAEMGDVQINTAQFTLQKLIDEAPVDMKIKLATAAGVNLDNENKIIGNYVAEATKDDLIQASKLGIRALELQNINADLANIGLKLTNDGKIVSNEIAEATKGLKIGREALENARMILANKSLYVTYQGQVLDLEKSQAAHAKEMERDSIKLQNEIDEAKKTADYNNVYKAYAKRAALEVGTPGAFATAEEANQFILDGLFQIDPALSKELANKYATSEIQHITNQSTLLKKRAFAALAEKGLDGLRAEVDKINGINGVEVVKGKDGSITLNEINQEGRKIRTIATGKDETEFNMNLNIALDPASMMEISKTYQDTLKTEAETEYYKEMAKAKGLKPALTKDQWAIQRISNNPNDPLAVAILLGEGVDLEMIQEMSLEADIDNTAEDETPSSSTETETETETEPLSQDDIDRQTLASLNKGVKKNTVQKQTKKKETEKRLASNTTNQGIKDQIKATQDEIKRIQDKTKKGKTDDRDIARAEKKIKELQAKLQGLAANSK